MIPTDASSYVVYFLIRGNHIVLVVDGQGVDILFFTELAPAYQRITGCYYRTDL